MFFSTWPVYGRLERALKGRRWLTTLAMILFLVLVLVLPMVAVAWTYGDERASGAAELQSPPRS